MLERGTAFLRVGAREGRWTGFPGGAAEFLAGTTPLQCFRTQQLTGVPNIDGCLANNKKTTGVLDYLLITNLKLFNSHQ